MKNKIIIPMLALAALFIIPLTQASLVCTLENNETYVCNGTVTTDNTSEAICTNLADLNITGSNSWLQSELVDYRNLWQDCLTSNKKPEDYIPTREEVVSSSYYADINKQLDDLKNEYNSYKMNSVSNSQYTACTNELNSCKNDLNQKGGIQWTQVIGGALGAVVLIMMWGKNPKELMGGNKKEPQPDITREFGPGYL